MNRGREGEGDRQQPKVQPRRFMRVRQTTGEASSSSSSVEQEEQPRVSAGAPNIFKDSRQQMCTTYRGKMYDICTPMGYFCPDDTLPNEVQDSEKEEQCQQVSDWSEDIENAHDFRARVPTLRRRPGQPPNAITVHPSKRRRPAGWLSGVLYGLMLRPDFSTRPDLPP